MVKNLAAKLGVPPAMALKMLAKHLPGIIDKLTPDGKVPSGTKNINGQDILGKLIRK